MNKIIAILTLSFISSITFAQSAIDVVYLKNGGKIKGLVIEQVPSVSLKIETADGSIFAYKMDEIEKITKERDIVENRFLNEDTKYERRSIPREELKPIVKGEASSAFRIEAGPSFLSVSVPGTKPSWGFNFGLKYESMFNRFIGLDYGLEYKMYFDEAIEVLNNGRPVYTIPESNIAFLQLPASFILRYELGKKCSMQFKSGVFLQLGLFLYAGSKETYGGVMNRVNLGYTGGVDFNIQHFVVGLKYDLGLLDFYATTKGVKSSTLALLLGYKF